MKLKIYINILTKKGHFGPIGDAGSTGEKGNIGWFSAIEK